MSRKIYSKTRELNSQQEGAIKAEMRDAILAVYKKHGISCMHGGDEYWWIFDQMQGIIDEFFVVKSEEPV